MTFPLIPDNSFPPERNAPCFCGSGERFKRCCGLRSAERPPPHGVGVLEAFLRPAECRELVSLADRLEGERFKVRDRARNMAVTPDPTRVCEWLKLGEHQLRLDDLVYRAFQEQILPRTGLTIDWYEEPQLLRYTAGGFYSYHSDAYDPVPEEKAWRRAVDRDISLLLYLNDDFEGGELELKRFSYLLRPKAGMLVWFPSDWRYEHMARPVISGCRYAIVSWAAATGVERVKAYRPNRSIRWISREKKTSA
jgi:predicted 2-oxoglutarate/Fe(II)-dependent dioxygenase YbiX